MVNRKWQEDAEQGAADMVDRKWQEDAEQGAADMVDRKMQNIAHWTASRSALLTWYY
jgi:hypothetical protein